MERGCASEELEAQCISTSVANTDLEYVSCQETCQTTGCNVGWRKLLRDRLILFAFLKPKETEI